MEQAPQRHDEDLAIDCRVYTHARRHPVVIGNIQGLRIPPVTPAQLVVGVGSLVLLVAGYPLWAHFGGAVNGFLMVAIPLGLAFAARALRVEGRAPWRAGLGWLMLVVAPRRGTRLGKPERTSQLVRQYRRAWVADIDFGRSGRRRPDDFRRSGCRQPDDLRRSGRRQPDDLRRSGRRRPDDHRRAS